MKHTLTWDNIGFFVDGKPAPFISGEFHYFRVPHDDWERRLILLKESGANAVATYIPWIVHEETEGNIVFDDCPQRNLTEFFTLCDKLDLMVIARPGPYQYAELVRNGLPVWLTDGHPEILAQRQNGEIITKGAVSYLHPLFLEKAEKYIRAACEKIRPFLVTNGGPIVSVQVDNELCGVQVWSGSIDYNPAGMGVGETGGHYPEFLKEKYGTVSAMNAAYGTDFADFTDVNPQRDAPSTDTVFGQRFSSDYLSSYCKSIEKYAAHVVSWLRDSGIDVPLCANAASLNESPLLYNLPSVLSSGGMPCLMGTDHYYTLNPDWDNNPTPQQYLKWIASLDIINEIGSPRTLFEMQGGNLSDFPAMYVEPLSAFYMTQNALGLQGANYYIFTGGPNFNNTGHTGDVYDYCAAVSADGEIRPHYYCQKERNEHSINHSWMQRAERKYNIQLGFTWEQRRQDRYAPRFARDDIKLNKYTEDICFAMLGEGYHPKYIELSHNLDITKPLVLTCDGRMAKEKQENVVEFLKAGGKMLITPFVPELDEDFNPCTILKDFLGVGKIERIPNSAQNSICFQDGEKAYGFTKTYTCDIADAEPIMYRNENDVPVAYKKRVGKGEFIWLGGLFVYKFFSQNMLIDRLFRMLGAEPVAECSGKALWTTVIEDGNNATCFVINLLCGKQKETIKVNANGKVHDLGEIEVPAMTVLTFDL